jgi:hypothetical protein
VWVSNAVNLRPELDERVRLLTAKTMFSEATASDLVALACDLLVDGVDTPAVVLLAILPFTATMTEAEPVFRDAIAELGRPPLPKEQAGWVLAASVARQMAANSIPQHVGARVLWGLWWDLGNPPEIAAFVQLLDAWEEVLPQDRRPIEDEMRSLAPSVIEAADRVIASSQ